MDAYIRSSQFPLQTEQIIGVCQEKWTVKPSHTKRLITPNSGGLNSSEWGSHDSRVDEGGSVIRERANSVKTATASLSYICRPSHRQPPHSGEQPNKKMLNIE